MFIRAKIFINWCRLDDDYNVHTRAKIICLEHLMHLLEIQEHQSIYIK